MMESNATTSESFACPVCGTPNPKGYRDSVRVVISAGAPASQGGSKTPDHFKCTNPNCQARFNRDDEQLKVDGQAFIWHKPSLNPVTRSIATGPWWNLQGKCRPKHWHELELKEEDLPDGFKAWDEAKQRQELERRVHQWLRSFLKD